MKRIKQRENTTKKFVPQPRSGGFAILKALKEENGDLKKEELKDAAQEYCDTITILLGVKRNRPTARMQRYGPTA